MINFIKHYLQVYGKFVAVSSAVNMSFRTNFLLLVLVDMTFYAGITFGVSSIFDHISTIGPWNQDQLLFFLFFMLSIDALHMTLVANAFWEFSEEIRTGHLDYVLLKPINSIFVTFFRFFRPSGALGLCTTIAILIYLGLKIQLPLTSWILLPFLLALAFLMFITIEFIISISTFWVIEGMGIHFLRIEMQRLSRWPEFIYHPLSRRVLTVALPILLVGSAPVHFLYDHSNYKLLLGMVIAIVTGLWILSKLWVVGVRRYESASS